MTKHKRNIEGMINAAKAKRMDAINRVNKSLDDLANEDRPISFNSISKAAGVSKAWIYRQVDIRRLIENLRLKQSEKKAPQQSSIINNSLINTLKNRIKKLEVENNEMRKQIEVLYGKFYINNTN